MGVGLPTFENELKQGQLPEPLLDELQLMDPSSENGRVFQQECDAVLRRLTGGRHDPAAKPVRFLLSSSPLPNAFLMRHAVPATVGITMGMLRLVEAENELPAEQDIGSEDQLAGLIIHELGHDFFNEKLGDNRPITKGEEAVADLRTVATLRDAVPPYHQMGLSALIRKFPQDDFEAWYKTVADEHPNKGNRLRMMENAGALVNRERGGPQKNLLPTSFSDGMQRMMQRVIASTRLGNFLHAKGYERDTVVGKLNTLDDMLHTQLNGPTEYGSGRPDRREVESIVAGLEHLKFDTGNDAEAQALQRVVKSLLMIDHGFPAQDVERYSSHLSWQGYLAGLRHTLRAEGVSNIDIRIRQGDGGHMFLPAMPAVKEAEDAVRTFVEAKTPEAAETAAVHLVDVSRRYDPIMLSNIHLPTFRLPKDFVEDASPDEPRALPWHRHEEWAIARPGSRILDGLIVLGVTGNPQLASRIQQRQAELAPPKRDDDDFTYTSPRPRDRDDHRLEKMATLQEDSGIGSPTRLRYSDGKLYHLGWQVRALVDRDGRLIGAPQKEREIDPVTPDQVAFRDALETSLLPTVDWKAMEEDFWGFTKAYQRELRPNFGQVEAQNPFAHAFLDHLMTFQRNDPKRWNATIRQFFTGRDDGNVTWPSLLKSPAYPLYKHEQYLLQDDGISIRHPLMKFVEQDPFQLFSLNQKMWVLDYCRHAVSHHFSMYDHIENLDEGYPRVKAALDRFPRTLSDPKYEWQIDNETVFGFETPRTPEALKAIYDRVGTERQFKDGFRHPMLIHALQHETLQFLRHCKAVGGLSQRIPPELQRDIRRLMDIEASHYTDKYGDGLTSEMSSQLSPITKADERRLHADEMSPKRTIGELVETYCSHASDSSGYGYFGQHDDLRIAFEAEIQRRLKHMDDPSHRKDVLETLLSPHSYPDSPLMQYCIKEERALQGHRHPRRSDTEYRYGADLANPVFRRFVIDAFVGDTVATIGKDDGTLAYAARFKVMADHVMSKVNLSYALELLPKIAEGTETQRELSYYVRDKVQGGGLQQIVNGRFAQILGETAINEIVQDEEKRKAALDYLTAPLTDASLGKFLGKTQIHTRQSRTNVAARLLHQNFWDLPFEGRTLAIEMLLFPAHDKSAEGLQHNIDFALDKALPVAPPAERSKLQTPRMIRRYLSGTPSFNIEQNCIGRDIINAYLGVCDVPERRLLMAAMLVSQRPAEGKIADMGVGEALRLILDNGIGPAGRKLAQAIHSHPETPESIRKEMGSSKSMAAKPYRWQLFEWLEKDGPKPANDNRDIVHVGDILGSGAYGVTIEATRRDGQHSAITQLRPYVREQAEHGFSNLEKAVKTLIVKQPGLSPVRDMIAQAKHMSVTETDMALAERQSRNAAALYDGLNVRVDGRNIRFSTAPWLGHGSEYKETAIIGGEHFNDLPAGRDKTVMAKAVLTSEILALLKGGPFDHDRHGAQQRIQGDRVGNFDFGAMSLEPMTARQKELVGDVLAGAMQDLMSARNPMTALVGRIKALGTSADDRRFLASFERSILAWNDYIPSAGISGLAGAFASIINSDAVDPVISERMHAVLGETGYRRMKTGLSFVGKGIGFSYEDGSSKIKAAAATSVYR